ncbi:hypothetical protein F6854_23505, partial [Salmonella enterica]|nr:hypothetical protein [Salmonella enterica]
NIITIIVAIIIVFYAGMWSQKFLMEDECLDSGGSYNENGICNIAGSHQDVPPTRNPDKDRNEDSIPPIPDP